MPEEVKRLVVRMAEGGDRLFMHELVHTQVLTYADVCGRMRTYADVCSTAAPASARLYLVQTRIFVC